MQKLEDYRFYSATVHNKRNTTKKKNKKNLLDMVQMGEWFPGVAAMYYNV